MRARLRDRPTFAKGRIRRGGPPPYPPMDGFAAANRRFPVSAARTCPAVASREGGFTLIELMVVIGIMLVLTLLLVPAFTSMKNAGDVTSAAYTIKGALEQARTYAMANNTYTWVGLFEEDISKSAGTLGVGKVVISAVASIDGTTVYDAGSPGSIDATRLRQIGKLTKIDNVHVPIFKSYPSVNTGNTFDTRPATAPNLGRFGDLHDATKASPSTDSQFPFQYPVGNPKPTAQYTFTKTLQFSPRGESRVNSTYDVRTQVEIGLQPTHGSAPDGNVLDANGKLIGNLVAVQISGIAGNIKIYQR